MDLDTAYAVLRDYHADTTNPGDFDDDFDEWLEAVQDHANLDPEVGPDQLNEVDEALRVVAQANLG